MSARSVGLTVCCARFFDNFLFSQLLLFSSAGQTVFRFPVESFLRDWKPGGSVVYTPLGLAWRAQWGPNRYAGDVLMEHFEIHSGAIVYQHAFMLHCVAFLSVCTISRNGFCQKVCFELSKNSIQFRKWKVKQYQTIDGIFKDKN